MIKRKFYGWYDEQNGAFRLSLMPPDAPVRPSVELKTRAALDDYLRRKRGTVVWWPRLVLKEQTDAEGHY